MARHFSSVRAVENTVAPNNLAIWIAVQPMPLLPPLIRFVFDPAATTVPATSNPGISVTP